MKYLARFLKSIARARAARLASRDQGNPGTTTQETKAAPSGFPLSVTLSGTISLGFYQDEYLYR